MNTLKSTDLGNRMANVFFDALAIFLLIVLAVLLAGDVSDNVGGCIVFAVWFAYYFLSEGITQRTLGKLTTGTLVVSRDGTKPTWGQIATRTICRFIPFNAFSGLFGAFWHDSLSGTLVVEKNPVQGSEDGR